MRKKKTLSKKGNLSIGDLKTEIAEEYSEAEFDLSLGDLPTMDESGFQPLGDVDRYLIVSELGAGGFGTVFLAKDTVAGTLVALKALPSEIAAIPEELENVRNNFALVSKLHHPNIAGLLHLHKVEKCDDAAEKLLRISNRSYLVVMEYVEGMTLSAWKKQFPDRKIPFEKAVEICGKVAEALDYAHSRNIIHRDVKPANIMIGADASVKVMDFGLAAEVRSSMSRVSREQFDTSGTRPYMAPEQWAGKEQKSATDQYALAVMFYELIKGSVPFQSVFETGDAMLMMNLVKTEPPEPLPELSKNQNAVLLRALSKKPRERFASCGKFINNLAAKNAVGSRFTIVKIATLVLVILGLAAVYMLAVMKQSVGKSGAPAKNIVQKTEKNNNGKIDSRQTAILRNRAQQALNNLEKLNLQYDARQRKLYAAIKESFDAGNSLYKDVKEYTAAHDEFNKAMLGCRELLSIEQDKKKAVNAVDEYKNHKLFDYRGISADTEQAKLIAEVKELQKSLTQFMTEEKYTTVLENIDQIYRKVKIIEQRERRKLTAENLISEVKKQISACEKLQLDKKNQQKLANAKTLLSSMYDCFAMGSYDKITRSQADSINETTAKLKKAVSDYAGYLALADRYVLSKDYAKAADCYRRAKAENQLPEIAEKIKSADNQVYLHGKYCKYIAEAEKALKQMNWNHAENQFRYALKLEKYSKTTRAEAGIEEAGLGKERSRMADLKKQYEKCMAAAGKALAGSDWQGAINSYKDAMKVNGYGNDAAAITGIENVKKAKELARLAALKKTYDNHIASGNAELAKQNWKAAKECFNQALSVEGYEKDQAAVTGIKLAESGPERMRLAALKKEYDNHIAAGNAELAKQNWKAALECFGNAVKVEGYTEDEAALKGMSTAKDELEKIRIAELKKKYLTKFNALIAEGKKALFSKDWKQAETAFRAALQVPGYSADRTAMSGIQSVKDGVESTRKAKLKKQYEALIEIGNSQVAKEDWAAAERTFRQALSIEGFNQAPVAVKGLGKAQKEVKLLLARRKAAAVYQTTVSEVVRLLNESRNLKKKAAYEKCYSALEKINNFILAGYYHFIDEASQKNLDKLKQQADKYLEKYWYGPPRVGDSTVSGLGMKFVYVAPGSFQMGSNNGDSDEKPVHKVTISRGYWIGKYEVTIGEFLEYLKAANRPSGFRYKFWAKSRKWYKTGRYYNKDSPIKEEEDGKYALNDDLLSGSRHGKSLKQPMCNVDWNGARLFCEWLTKRERVAGRLPSGYEYRLPTEAEWEFAARGGGKSRGYEYSGSNNVDSIAWYDSNSNDRTHEVGTKSGNELGIHDMSGNVKEWCYDWYGTYPGGSTTDPTGASSGSYRVLRGGSWSYTSRGCRSANRLTRWSGGAFNSVGFRVAFAPVH